MHRHRTRIVVVCLLALAWCQIAAAGQWCGPGAFDAMAAPCHDEGTLDGGGCDASGCPASHGVGFGAPDAPALLPLAPEFFALRGVVELAHEANERQPAALSTGPPAHFLGRLLI